MAGLTQEQADLLYSAILHLHEDHYAALVHSHDHGALSGLGDDDHTQYFDQVRGDARYLRSVPQQDHGGLAGLADDDHSQYYNETRGDARYVRSGVAPTWTAPTLLNGWVNNGGDYAPAGWYKGSDGIVHLRGVMKSGLLNVPMFTLPTGSRPAYHAYYFGVTQGALAWFEVFTNGDVKMATGVNTWAEIDGITFDT